MQLFKFFHTENKSNFKTQTAKNGGFFEELLSENDFEAVLVNFCCYEYGVNASEAVQKISTRILLRVSRSGGKHHYMYSYCCKLFAIFFFYLLLQMMHSVFGVLPVLMLHV